MSWPVSNKDIKELKLKRDKPDGKVDKFVRQKVFKGYGIGLDDPKLWTPLCS